MSTQEDFLRQYIIDSGMTQTDLARETGIEQSSLSRFIKGKQRLSMDNLFLLMDFFRLSITPNKLVTEDTTIKRIGVNAPVEKISDGENLQTIQVYSAAGAGSPFDPDSVSPLCTISAPPEYLRYSDLAVLVSGHSMEPLLPNDSIVGVKRDVPFQANELYVASIPYEGLVVKRVAVSMETGEYIFKSENPNKEAYPDFRVLIAESEKIIIGRVVWVMLRY